MFRYQGKPYQLIHRRPRKGEPFLTLWGVIAVAKQNWQKERWVLVPFEAVGAN